MKRNAYISRAKALRKKGMSINEIVQALNKEGFKTLNKTKIDRSNVTYALNYKLSRKKRSTEEPVHVITTSTNPDPLKKETKNEELLKALFRSNIKKETKFQIFSILLEE